MGSLMMRFTSRPAMRPASFVACRWLSLKYAAHAHMHPTLHRCPQASQPPGHARANPEVLLPVRANTVLDAQDKGQAQQQAADLAR